MEGSDSTSWFSVQNHSSAHVKSCGSKYSRVISKYRLQIDTNQYKLLDDISYLNFLHRIFPTWILGESPNRKDIPARRLLI